MNQSESGPIDPVDDLGFLGCECRVDVVRRYIENPDGRRRREIQTDSGARNCRMNHDESSSEANLISVEKTKTYSNLIQKP